MAGLALNTTSGITEPETPRTETPLAESPQISQVVETTNSDNSASEVDVSEMGDDQLVAYLEGLLGCETGVVEGVVDVESSGPLFLPG